MMSKPFIQLTTRAPRHEAATPRKAPSVPADFEEHADSGPGSALRGLADTLFVASQYLLPHHLLSRAMHAVTRSEWRPFKDALIRAAVQWYEIDVSEAAEQDLSRYPSFNAFFTRSLRPEARPWPDVTSQIGCPADGNVSQLGDIRGDSIFQAKGRDYSLTELLGGNACWAARFAGGRFATIYLSPRDYHRVHLPFAGTLRRMIHVPGRLFSVNPATTRKVPRLFARNERVVCLFDTSVGPMAVILVGAIFVASIDTIWAGPVTPRHRQPTVFDYSARSETFALARGSEIGRFNMGSTVIVLFPRGAMDWSSDLSAGCPVRVGQVIGAIRA